MLSETGTRNGPKWLFALALSLAMFGTAEAQVSQSEATRILETQGFDQIELRRNAGGYVGEACQGDTRYQVRVRDSGFLGQPEPIGDCERRVTLESAQRLLEQNGYFDIALQDVRGGFTGTACKGSRQYQVRVRNSGDFGRPEQMGRCPSQGQKQETQTALSLDQIGSALSAKGYDTIKFINRTPPRYRVEACLRNELRELIIATDGGVLREDVIGRCGGKAAAPRTLPPENLAADLERQGFKQVEIINDQRPPYQASACDGNVLVELAIDAFGQVLTKSRVGSCGSSNLEDIAATLKYRGVKRLRFFAEGCRGGRLIRFELNSSGDTIDRQRIGQC